MKIQKNEEKTNDRDAYMSKGRNPKEKHSFFIRGANFSFTQLKKNGTFSSQKELLKLRAGGGNAQCLFFLGFLFLAKNDKGQITTQSISKESPPTSQSIHRLLLNELRDGGGVFTQSGFSQCSILRRYVAAGWHKVREPKNGVHDSEGSHR